MFPNSKLKMPTVSVSCQSRKATHQDVEVMEGSVVLPAEETCTKNMVYNNPVIKKGTGIPIFKKPNRGYQELMNQAKHAAEPNIIEIHQTSSATCESNRSENEADPTCQGMKIEHPTNNLNTDTARPKQNNLNSLTIETSKQYRTGNTNSKTINHSFHEDSDAEDDDSGIFWDAKEIPIGSFGDQIFSGACTIPASYESFDLQDFEFEEVFPTNPAPVLGTESLDNKEQLIIQKEVIRTSFLARCLNSIKLVSKSRFLVYEDAKTKAPFLSVTQSRNVLGQHLEGIENLQFIVNSEPDECQSPESSLMIHCNDCSAIDCSLHNAEVFICNGIVKLGSCEFLSCEKSTTSLLLKNIITAEAFIVRYNRNKGFSEESEQDFKVVEKFDLDNDDHPSDPLDEATDGPVIALISCIKPNTPDENLVLNFTEKLSSLSKALILSGTLLINFDLLQHN